MHVKSEDIPSSGNVTFVVGAWKSNRLAWHDATPLAALASAAMSASSSSPWNGGSLFTPVQHAKSPPSMTPTVTAGKAGARRDATPNNQHANIPMSNSLSEGDLAKRNFVLEVIRKQKLTRRTVAEQASILDFRAMNYWLRGKEVDDVTVKESGRKLMEWAIKIDPRAAASKSSKFEDADAPTTDDEEDHADEHEQDEEEDRSPRARNSGKKVAAKRKKETGNNTPSQANKKTRATPTSSSSIPAANVVPTRAAQKTSRTSAVFAEPAPRVAPLTPIPKDKSLTPFGTPNLSRMQQSFMDSPMLTSPGTFAWNSPVPFSPFIGQTPISTNKKPRTSSIDDQFRGELTPLQSPMTSPLRSVTYGNSSYKDIGLTDDMFNGMEMPTQTPMPSRTQGVDNRTPLTGTRATPRSASSSSSSATQQRQPRRQLSFDER